MKTGWSDGGEKSKDENLISSEIGAAGEFCPQAKEVGLPQTHRSDLTVLALT